MSQLRWGRSRYAMLFLVLVTVLQTAFYYPQLPNIVASHFDGLGQPNGWSSKNAFFFIYLTIVAITVLVFSLMPASFKFFPTASFSLPNKNYWLAEPRRKATLTYIQQQMEWFGVASLALVIGVIQLALNANLNANANLSTPLMWSLLAAYFLYVIVWQIRFYTRFKRINS